MECISSKCYYQLNYSINLLTNFPYENITFYLPPRLQFVTGFLVFMLVCNFSHAQIKLLSNGKVGIGTTAPSTPLEIHLNTSKFSFINSGLHDAQPVYIDRSYEDARFYQGSNHYGYLGLQSNFWKYIYADKLWYVLEPAEYSDKRIKKNVKPLENSLEKILKLKAVEYNIDLNELGIPDDLPDDSPMKKKHFGLIAQDVLEVIPEIVEKDSIGYAVNYTSLIPLLIEAIKAQNGKIKNLENKISSDGSNAKDAESPNLNTESTAFLGKNRPNPFTENTTIDYFLPSGIQQAELNVYNLEGKQLKSIEVTERENGQVIIHGSELQPGIYYYSLIADGQVIGTEKMILTD
jgi:hypothetical protein